MLFLTSCGSAFSPAVGPLCPAVVAPLPAVSPVFMPAVGHDLHVFMPTVGYALHFFSMRCAWSSTLVSELHVLGVRMTVTVLFS